MTERIKTITGLDKMLNGGIPNKSTVLIAGKAGAGKTLLSLQCCKNACLKGKTVYFSFNQTREQLMEQAENAGIDIDDAVINGTLNIENFEPVLNHELYERMNDALNGAKFVVFDSITDLCSAFKDSHSTRVELKNIQTVLKQNNCTAFWIAESTNQALTKDKESEHIADGIIYLDNDKTRTLKVLKMRSTSHSADESKIMIGKGVQIGK